MKTLYFQYGGKVSDCWDWWSAELSIVTDKSEAQLLIDLFRLLDAYEHDTITSEEQNELDTIEAKIACDGFYFADRLEDLPLLKYGFLLCSCD